MSDKLDEYYKEKLFAHLQEKTFRTLDVFDIKLEYGELIPIFVYDTLQKGQKDDWLLSEFPYFGTATSFHDNFYLTNYNNSDILFEESTELKSKVRLVNSNFKRVQGEVYGISLDMLYYLDSTFHNGFNYVRDQMAVMLNDQEAFSSGGYDYPKGPILRNCLYYRCNEEAFFSKKTSPYELQLKFIPAPYIESKFYDAKVYSNRRK